MTSRELAAVCCYLGALPLLSAGAFLLSLPLGLILTGLYLFGTALLLGYDA